MHKYKRDVCLITNVGSHYREPIFRRMAEELGCHFYLGDRVRTSIKRLDYDSLPGYQRTLRNLFLGPFYWQRSSVRLVFAPYRYYILDGEPYCLSSWAILLLARLMGKRTIAWTHGWYGRESQAKRWVKLSFYALFSRLMVYGEYAIGLMREQGIPAEKMRCIANSLDSDREREIRSTLRDTDVYTAHFGNTDPTIIYCGRIQRIKRLDTLLDAAMMLRDEGLPVNVVLVGKDVEQVGLRQEAERRGIADRVWMYGPCYDDQRLGELFHNAVVCVSPCNVGLTAIHALTFGCPMVIDDDFSHHGPEFEAIRPGVTGDFFRRGDTADMVAKIRYWVTRTDRTEVRRAAYEEIDRKWNIHYQMRVIREMTDRA